MEEAVWKFVQALLEEATRVLVPLVVALIGAWVAYGIAWLRAKMGETRWAAIEETVRFAVLAAEQSGLREATLREGQKKKALAMAFAQEFLAARGIRLDVGRLDVLIEAEVMRSLNLQAVVESRSRLPF